MGDIASRRPSKGACCSSKSIQASQKKTEAAGERCVAQ